ncbi:hypothetical protein [Pyrinomonas methylaliphatogenes]|uniref:DUF3618 domain-containing protein n=1 Tax=Pyrinomonas methylaliphatogenes TaxID=454194 RepID=A0A0B6WXA2_9BACT|nr:hypothetical protein [Pyrinomonas methylaliphatogenes]CDM65691.1 hypothetical protein PYK22_01696 [Pyrinomonas methylaliphatogenes]
MVEARDQSLTEQEATKEELQRRMEEARESIAQTVEEIRDTVSTQYQQVKEALDWREQYRRHPLVFTAGAFSAGFLLGYGIAGTLKGEGERWDTEGIYPTASHYDRAAPEQMHAARPGLFERFQQTRAYERLQEELSNIGDRLIEQLSTTAQTVVLPLLLAKLKEAIGLETGKRAEAEPEARPQAQKAAASTGEATRGVG